VYTARQQPQHPRDIPLLSIPDNSTVHFYAGISHLALNDLERARSSLQKTIADENSQLTEPAEWYSGLLYLKENDLEKARAILNNIISMDGMYKERAMELLNRLN